MSFLRRGSTVLVCLLAAGAATAGDFGDRAYYDDHRVLGAALQTSVPYDTFGDRQNTGYGLHAIADYPVRPLLSLVGDLGLNHFDGSADRPDLNVWELCAGAKFNLPPFYIGGEVGYYSGVDQVSWVPSMGLRFERVDLAVRWKAVGTDAWTSFRAGFYLF